MGEEISKSRYRRLCSILDRVLAWSIIVGVVVFWVYRLCNPNDLNHFLIINCSENELTGPLRLEFISENGTYKWSREFGGLRVGGCAVLNTDRAFLDGTLRIIDHTQTAHFAGELRAPGRYCGTAVAVIRTQYDEYHEGHWTFNTIELCTPVP